MAGRLQDRVAIVTGGGKGIGRATAERFAAEGARVLIATRTGASGEDAAAAIRASGGLAQVMELDAGSPDAAASAVGKAVDLWGRLDIIVHNAAFVPYGVLAGLDDSAFVRAMDTNVTAAFRFLKAGVPHMEKHGVGRLIVTSSTAAKGPIPTGLAAYGTTKAALEGLVRGAAVELAPRGITVNGVAPGATLTPSMEHDMSAAAIAELKKTMPLGRIGASEDIAAAMLYLASDDGAYVTGQTLVVDGAQTLSRDMTFETMP